MREPINAEGQVRESGGAARAEAAKHHNLFIWFYDDRRAQFPSYTTKNRKPQKKPEVLAERISLLLNPVKKCVYRHVAFKLKELKKLL